MKLVYDLHVFLHHKNFEGIKSGLRANSYGPDCILFPSDINHLLAHIGKCVICIMVKLRSCDSEIKVWDLSTKANVWLEL